MTSNFSFSQNVFQSYISLMHQNAALCDNGFRLYYDNVADAYFHFSVYLAQFPEYTYELINHLVEVKMEHWDR